MVDMNRRRFLNAATLTTAAALAREKPAGAADATRRIEAVAFDGFAIFDPRPIAAAAEAAFPGKGAALMPVWRTRQFEYTWLRTLTGNYVNFWQVTQDALVFACAANNLELTRAIRDRLMGTYLQLEPWPDVAPTLRSLRSAGVRLAFLSNFTAAMLDANIRGAGFDELFEARLSTDAVSAFKPDPRSYQMAVDHFKLPRTAIAFVAFGGWDAAGARRFGFPVYWGNRLSQPAEELGAMADRTAVGLEALAAFVADR
jgi:2-haloacid dehalogenase